MHKFFACLGLVFLAAACSTGLSEEDCRYADWEAIGYDDGAAGRDRGTLLSRSDQCAAYGVRVDRQTYLRGYDRGLEALCRPLGALQAAGRGLSSLSSCPALDGETLAAFNLGREYHEAESRVRSLRARIRSVENRIDALFDDRRRDRRRAREREREAREDREEGEIRLRTDDDDRDRFRERLLDLRSDIRRLEWQLEDAERDLYLVEGDYRARERELGGRNARPRPRGPFAGPY